MEMANMALAFDAVLRDFLTELVDCSPPCDAVTKAKVLVGMMPGLPEGKLATEFMKSVGEHAGMIMSKDPAVFETLAVSGVTFKEVWALNPDQQTREAIWKHLQMLVLLGAGAIMPPETRKVLEATAASTAAKIQSGEIDVFGLLQSLGGSTGDFNPMALLGGMKM